MDNRYYKCLLCNKLLSSCCHPKCNCGYEGWFVFYIARLHYDFGLTIEEIQNNIDLVYNNTNKSFNYIVDLIRKK